MRSLSLDQLRTLKKVVELASFTAASRQLNLSQSAVSTQIRELEERLGVRLINRIAKKAYATDAGEQVILLAQRIARDVDAIEAVGRRYRDGWLGRVSLGAGPNILAYMLPQILKRLAETQPQIEISIRTGTTRDMVQLILTNELDLALITLPVDEPRLKIERLRDDDLVAVLPATLIGAPDFVTPAFLAGYPLVLDGRSQADRMARSWLKAAGFDAKPIMELGIPDAIRNVVAAGLGVTILGPECVGSAAGATGGIIARPLKPAICRTIAIAQHRDRLADPAFVILRAALRELGALLLSPVTSRS
jgi:DNA-binding transcriptional LysR family regulator